jgi:hypothetical protein
MVTHKRSRENEDEGSNDYLGLMIRNPSPIQDWKITGFKYKQIFTKETIASTPPFNSTGMTACNKWYVLGFCYEKCDRHATHKSFDLATHKSNYDKWVKELKLKNP